MYSNTMPPCVTHPITWILYQPFLVLDIFLVSVVVHEKTMVPKLRESGGVCDMNNYKDFRNALKVPSRGTTSIS